MARNADQPADKAKPPRKDRLPEAKRLRIVHGRLLRMSDRRLADKVPASNRTVRRHSPKPEMLKFIWDLAEAGILSINPLSESPPENSGLK